MLVEIFLLALLGWFVWYRKQGARMREMGNKFPGPKALPILGNALQLGTTTAELLVAIHKFCKEYSFCNKDSAFRLWIGPSLYIILNNPKDFEIVLGSTKLIEKGDLYQYMLPWLGTGLLTSTGPKWRKHRKILTPTFHFKILEEFVDVFDANGSVLVDKLSKNVNGPAFDIYNHITLFALDNICETAMGVKIDAQNDSESVFVKAIRDMSYVVMKRTLKPWLHPEFLFNLTSYKTIQDNSLKVLHDVTSNVIKTRRAEMHSQEHTEAAKTPGDGVKKRLAFLDMLIESTFNGSEMSDQDIREEVNTFMFEGHDTTSSAISFALWLLSRNSEIQEKVYQEIMETFPDPAQPLTFRGLQELKYMELVIKETLRQYPSVPVYARKINENLELSNGLMVPKGSTVAIAAIMSRQNPNVWPSPQTFDPERFRPDNIQGRHPYAFVPFSAGPRNCIGQKFAILETKSALFHILRNFTLLPASKEPDLVLATELILVSETGVKVKLMARTRASKT